MNEKARIAICDDEEDMRIMLQELLVDEGYTVECAADGNELRRLVPAFRPDLVICDLRMPGEDGLSLTRWLRAESHSAVLMLTGMGTVMDKVVGLEMGADDYLAKPFEPAELRARIKAVLRRSMSTAAVTQGRAPSRMKIGKCVIDTDQKCLFGEDGNKIPLTSMEYDLLHTFIQHSSRVLNRDQLLEMAHHQRWDPYDRSIDIRIARLRKKIEVDPAKPEVLKTVRGEGYMLVPGG